MAKGIRKTMLSLILCFHLLLIKSLNVQAFITNNHYMSNPKNVKIYVPSNLTSYNVLTYTYKWSSYCDEIGMSSVSSEANANIYFRTLETVDNGAYAITNFSSDSKHLVIVYKLFYTTSASHRNETIVHEVGHCLGLNHCRESDNSISVMRQYGFNDKAYPLSDDKKGIRYIYK